MNALANSPANRAAKIVVEEKQYLTFMLGGEMFSIGILCIKEIIWYANLTEVPMMPVSIRGVINLRGAVVPVVDSVQAVLEIASSEIEPEPSFGVKIRPDFIEGIAKVNGKFVILLNVNRVLSTEEIGQMGQVALTDLTANQ